MAATRPAGTAARLRLAGWRAGFGAFRGFGFTTVFRGAAPLRLAFGAFGMPRICLVLAGRASVYLPRRSRYKMRPMSCRSLALSLLLALLAGCGTNAAAVRAARDTYYDAPYAVIWNACSEEVRKRYVGIHLENAVQGRIETDYRV